jgi:sugar transferase (PEP-CTERM system associated)
MTSFRIVPKKVLCLFLGDALIIVGAYLLTVWFMARSLSTHILREYFPAEIVLLFAFPVVFYFAEFYDAELRFANPRYVFRHIAGMVAGSFLVLLVFFLFPRTNTGRSMFLIGSVLIGVGTLLWRFSVSWWFLRRATPKKRVLIIGAGQSGRMLYHTLKEDARYHVLGFMVEDDPAALEGEQLPGMICNSSMIDQIVKHHKVDVLVLAISNFKDPKLLKNVLDCKLDGVHVDDMPSFYEKSTGKVPVEHITDFWLVFAPLHGVKRSVYNLRLKRLLDVVLSLSGLAVTLPVTAAIALAIRLASRGPVLYRQRRVGLEGKIFTLVKFRSMTNGTDHDRQFAGEPNDPRVTWVGKIIRLSRLDEIPQMWNVLKGDMSFIGPRALIESEVREFESKVPYFSLRNAVRPGITGWAQVNYKHGVQVEDGLEKLQYDLFYIKNLSPLLDFLILMKTAKVVMYGKGAR